MTQYLDAKRTPSGTRVPVLRFGNVARNLVLKRLASLEDVTLRLYETDGDSLLLGEDGAPLSVDVTVHDTRFYQKVMTAGTVGAGEAWILGYWDCNDLTALIRGMLRNRQQLEGLNSGMARGGARVYEFLHGLRHNSKQGSRKNISAHYDLGNDFFEAFLDQRMMYSSAVFDHPGTSLELAQVAKLDRICQKLDLGPDDHVLEVGTGWGGFAIHAVSRYGCRVTTTTISEEQYEYAQERVREAGLEGRITLLLDDYRDLEGEYDKLVSIEMIEAVGADYLDSYARQLGRLVRRGGSVLIQAITIEDHRYEQSLKHVDFIKQFVFPGCFIPSINSIIDATTRNSDLTLRDLEDIGESYAMTLNHWRQRFTRRLDDIRAMGYPDSLIRLWLFYLCYCEAGFAERSISNVQLLFTRPVHWGTH